MGNIGLKELLLILLIVLILFGAKKVPELAKGLGSGLREFKKAAKELDSGNDNASVASSNVTPPAEGSSASDNERPR
jgi:sec-independent protein translocase protein TatA